MGRHNNIRRAARALAVTAVVCVPWLAGVAPAAAEEVRPICFPVLDPVTYRDDFGAPRSGHSHEGNDLIGRKMHRLVAAVSGVIVDLRWEAGTGHSDHGIRILGDDGYYYAYLHMNDDSPGTDDGQATIEQIFVPAVVNGARVRAGQLLGYMGDSGNAESSGAHLHFEIRRPAPRVWEAVAFSPYESLQAAARCPVTPTAPTGSFYPLGGGPTSSPDATSTGAGLLDAVVRGADGQVWHRGWNGQAFTEWEPLGGTVGTGATIVASANGRLDIFARGMDDQLWHRARIGGTWRPWAFLGGWLTSDPDAAAFGARVTVSVRGTDGAVWHRNLDGTTWSPWASAGGYTTSGPTVASPRVGTLVVHAVGGDGQLWKRTSTAGTWGAWSPVGGVLISDPDSTVEGGVVHVVALGTDHRIWTIAGYYGARWTQLSVGPFDRAPSAASWGPGRVDVFAVGADALSQAVWFSY